MNYEEAKREYKGWGAKPKPPKFPGRTLYKDDYLRYNEQTECYEIWTVKSKHCNVPNPHVAGGTLYKQIKNKADWSYELVAEIGPSETKIHFGVHTAGTIKRRFGLTARKPKSIKVGGMEYQDAHSKVISSDGVSYINGVLTANAPPTTRVFDKDNQKELNAKIRWARRWITVRHKLGAFDHLDYKVLTAKYPDWRSTRNTPSLELLNKIDPENVESFEEVLLYASVCGYWVYRSLNARKIDWITAFNAWVKNNREAMRQASGTVRYE